MVTTQAIVQSLAVSLNAPAPLAFDFAVARTRTHCMNDEPIIPLAEAYMEYMEVITVPGVLVAAGATYSPNVC